MTCIGKHGSSESSLAGRYAFTRNVLYITDCSREKNATDQPEHNGPDTNTNPGTVSGVTVGRSVAVGVNVTGKFGSGRNRLFSTDVRLSLRRSHTHRHQTHHQDWEHRVPWALVSLTAKSSGLVSESTPVITTIAPKFDRLRDATSNDSRASLSVYYFNEDYETILASLGRHCWRHGKRWRTSGFIYGPVKRTFVSW